MGIFWLVGRIRILGLVSVHAPSRSVSVGSAWIRDRQQQEEHNQSVIFYHRYLSQYLIFDKQSQSDKGIVNPITGKEAKLRN